MGAALAGGGIGGEAVADASPAFPPGGSAVPPADAPVAAEPPPANTDSTVIVLDSPARTNQLITTRELVVRGHLREGTERVQVLLQSRSAEPIVVRTVEPMTLPGYRDRSQQPAFVVTLPLPDPRPLGPAVVQIVAYDFSGRAKGVLLRPIQIGALLDPTYGGMAGRPPTGEDGLMGGIPFGTNFAPVDDGR